ncbi:MAG: glycosyltransferase family 2 protein [Microthrixaceae bacterium]|nr:glycosyltransferase family 2 protein [Microthrixaceae bacterium]
MGTDAAKAQPHRVDEHPEDPALELWIPSTDEPDPEVSIVIPALNEAITMETFVAWCHQGLSDAGVRGEILIVDSSDDETPRLAVASGARVLRTPRRGLGRAYLDAIPVIRAPWVIMGDADCTYDFRRLAPFIEAFRDDTEFVMGSRWKGTIEDGSMPALHRYFGTPFTTWILNLLYDSDFSDIHCGMRGLTLDALVRMRLVSQSWEYASEMVIKSVHLGLRTQEVPVRFLKDTDGRVSHHRREGWFSPFSAAWINLKAMFIHGADFFLVRPGLAALVVGLLLTVPLAAGPITVAGVTFTTTTMIFGLVVSTLGVFSYQLGLLARVIYDRRGMATERLLRRYRYTRTVGSAMVGGALGALATLPLLVRYVTSDFTLTEADLPVAHLAIAGLTLGIIGFATFAFTLLLHAVAAVRRD